MHLTFADSSATIFNYRAWNLPVPLPRHSLPGSDHCLMCIPRESFQLALGSLDRIMKLILSSTKSLVPGTVPATEDAQNHSSMEICLEDPTAVYHRPGKMQSRGVWIGGRGGKNETPHLERMGRARALRVGLR